MEDDALLQSHFTIRISIDFVNDSFDRFLQITIVNQIESSKKTIGIKQLTGETSEKPNRVMVEDKSLELIVPC